MPSEPERERGVIEQRERAGHDDGLLNVLKRIVGGHASEVLVMDRDGRVSRVEPRPGGEKR